MSTSTKTPRSAFVEQPVYNPEEFAVGLDVSRATVYRMLADGQLKSNKMRGKRKIPHCEFARLATEAA